MTYVPPPDPWEIDALARADTLQADVETIYLGTANDLLASSLDTLGQQVIATRDVLSTLNDLQTLHNQLTVANRSGFDKNATSNVTQYMTNASGYFSGIVPSVNAAALSQYSTLTNALQTQIATLASIDPSQVGPDSLVARATQVVNDLTANAAAAWVMDGYQSASPSSGQFQTNLTFAVNSAQSVNTTQQEQVRSMLFVFESFYQSAASIQSALKDIMIHMSQNIK